MKFKGIYKIRNCLNGKVYIGQSRELEERIAFHKRNYYRFKRHPLYNAITHYGIHNFEVVIIEEIRDEQLLDSREQYWMDYYKCTDPTYGYNILPFARSTKGYKITEETKRKISLKNSGKRWPDSQKKYFSLLFKGRKPWNTGKPHTEETKKKISIAHKGLPAWNKGITMSEEHRKRNSESHKGIKQTEETKRKRALVNTGKKRKEETKSKMRAAWIKRKEKIQKSKEGL